ncbi:UNVERIFIED_CONTAM: hypothetical protein K2H54_011407 [Gekko kuhli]
MYGGSRRMFQRLRAIFSRGRVAPLALKSLGRQEAAAPAPARQPHKRDPADFVEGYLSGIHKVRKQRINFLRAVSGVCKARKAKGLTTLPFDKEAVGEEIKAIMEDDFFCAGPLSLQAMNTLGDISRFQPPLSKGLRTAIAGWALQLVVNGTPGGDSPPGQGACKAAEEGLRKMLQELLREDPSASHLVGLLERVAYWMQSGRVAVRARAVSLSSSLLCFASGLPSFQMPDDAALGHLLVQLAVSLADPEADIRERARETLGQLYRMLLCHQGLRKKNTREPRWRRDPAQPWKEGYLHLIQVGEMFREHLTTEQTQAFLEAAWDHVLRLGQEWVREGGLFLLYSLLGRAQELLEEEEEDDVKQNLSALLYQLWRGREVPPEVQALLPKTGADPGALQASS